MVDTKLGTQSRRSIVYTPRALFPSQSPPATRREDSFPTGAPTDGVVDVGGLLGIFPSLLPVFVRGEVSSLQQLSCLGAHRSEVGGSGGRSPGGRTDLQRPLAKRRPELILTSRNSSSSLALAVPACACVGHVATVGLRQRLVQCALLRAQEYSILALRANDVQNRETSKNKCDGFKDC